MVPNGQAATGVTHPDFLRPRTGRETSRNSAKRREPVINPNCRSEVVSGRLCRSRVDLLSRLEPPSAPRPFWLSCWSGGKLGRMVACPTLETERLVLRPFRDDDLADYFAMEDSPEVRAGLGTSDEFRKPDAFPSGTHP